MRRESGASLVEAVVAAVLLSVGIVAVLGAVRAAARLEASGRWSAGGADRAAEALAALQADPCGAAARSGTLAGPTAVAWTRSDSGGLRTVDVVVSFPPAAGRRPAGFTAAFLCPRP